MESLAQEFRQAVRRLGRAPAFMAAAILTLGLAIGANTAVFTVVHRVVLNPLPYPDSDRLIQVDHGFTVLNIPTGMGVTRGLYLHYAERARTLDGIAAYTTRAATIVGSGESERVESVYTTASLAPVLRVAPAHGRWFVDTDAAPGAPGVAVLSHGFWMSRFGGDPSVVGRAVAVDGAVTNIIGVMPPSFAFPDEGIDLWMPEPLPRAAGFGTWEYDSIARLRDGATLADAQREMTALIADAAQAFPGDPLARSGTQGGILAVPLTLKEATIGTVARALWILLAAVGVVLLIACANVANLFLVRAETRQREIAVRRALGAGRGGIASVFFAESVLLSTAGGLAGLALGGATLRLLVLIGPANLPRLHEIELDAIALAFVFGLSVLTAALFAMLPLLGARRPSSSLLEAGRGQAAQPARHRARRVLVGAQVALALVLLVASGLLVRSFQNLRAVDPGFDAASSLTFAVALPEREYASRDAGVIAHRDIADNLSALPGVTAAGATTCLPLSGGCFGNTMRVEGRETPPGTVPPLALFRAVSAGYFEAMSIGLVRGRTITRDDVNRGDPVAVVSESLANTFFPNEEAIGRRVASNMPPAQAGGSPALSWLTIVGIVRDTPIRTPGEPFRSSLLYMPMSIAGGPDVPRLVGPSVSVMHYVVRSAVPPLDIVGSVRAAVNSVDAKLALSQVRPLQSLVDRALAQTAFTMVLLVIAGGLALTLGLIGIYGVMSYIVAQRTAEIGVRVALGAEPARITGLIVRQGGAVAFAGVVVGFAAAAAGARVIESLLYQISARDPGVFATTALVLFAVAILACWIPARRAARLNPVDALRMS